MSASYFINRRCGIAATIWLLVLLACLATVFSLLSGDGAPIETRITALLPQTHQSELLDESLALLDERVQQGVLFLVTGDSPATLVKTLQSELQNDSGVAFSDIAEFDDLRRQLQPFKNSLLSPQLREYTNEQWQQRALQGLFMPGVQSDLANDPFALLDTWLVDAVDTSITLQKGVPTISTADGTWALLSGQLGSSPFDLHQQTSIVNALDRFQGNHPEAQVLRSGVVFHAAAATAQARLEVSTIGLGSLLGVLLIGYVIFRRLQILFSLLLPVGCGLLFALSASLWVYGSINLLTLTFGASLVGLSVDYALHLQCFRLLHPERNLRRIWPALTLALISTLAAYLVQLATPLPGLRQMATFTSLGLIGAWLTVRLWLPYLPVRPHPFTARAASALSRISIPDGRRWPWLLLVFLMASSLLTIALRLHSDDDLRQINPANESLMAEQRQVQSLFSSATSNQFLLVNAADDERLLQRLEGIHTQLLALHQASHLQAFEHLARWVPSAQRQKQNAAIVEEAIHSALPEALQQAGLPPDAIARFTRHSTSSTNDIIFNGEKDVHSSPLLTPQKWFDLARNHPSTALWVEASDSHGPAALVLLGDMDAHAQAVVRHLGEAPDIQYIDRVNIISDALAALRKQIAVLMIVAIVLLSVILALRYRQKAWRALLPSIGAIIITLALISAAGTAITLFHLLGLLLVIGIGLDAGIFSAEHQDSQGAWLASSLSCLTSLLAFGLLALSSTPALSILGTTCLFGLICTWLLVPFARAGNLPLFSSYPGFSNT